MEAQPAAEPRTDEREPDRILARWRLRRQYHGRSASPPLQRSGPYETSYTISLGYPDRETMLPDEG